MVRHLVLLLILLAALAVPVAGGGAAGPAQPVFTFDPALSVAAPRPPALSADPEVVIKRSPDETVVRLPTEAPVAPYLGAERPPELSAEELRLLSRSEDFAALPDYKVEAGVGLFIEDKASFSLGYRFDEQLSDFNETRRDPLSLSGDLRISFDLKVPFD